MIEKNETDDVPVTSAFLDLVTILHSSKQRFIAETMLAESLGTEKPKDWHTRCSDLFHNEFAEHFKMAGLSLNRITFDSLMYLKVADELMKTEPNDLPLMFAFNPWLYQGKGGIKRLDVEAQPEPARPRMSA